MSEGNARVTEETIATSAETFGVRLVPGKLYRRFRKSADGYFL